MDVDYEAAKRAHINYVHVFGDMASAMMEMQ
jgi:hypothetical protein